MSTVYFDDLLMQIENQELTRDTVEVQSPTREEFETCYALTSGLTVKDLHDDLERFAIPCHCGDGSCQGWQMANKASFDAYQAWKEKE